jgi:hypothetical protein
LAACVSLGIGVVAFWPGEKEPEYNGKRLSEWLDIACTNMSSLEEASAVLAGNFAEIKSKPLLEAVQAVRGIGTNAVPCLVRWAAIDPRPPWKEKVAAIYWKLPRILQTDFVYDRKHSTGQRKACAHKQTG